jgi:hypothetical protein
MSKTLYKIDFRKGAERYCDPDQIGGDRTVRCPGARAIDLHDHPLVLFPEQNVKEAVGASTEQEKTATQSTRQAPEM